MKGKIRKKISYSPFITKIDRLIQIIFFEENFFHKFITQVVPTTVLAHISTVLEQLET